MPRDRVGPSVQECTEVAVGHTGSLTLPGRSVGPRAGRTAAGEEAGKVCVPETAGAMLARLRNT